MRKTCIGTKKKKYFIQQYLFRFLALSKPSYEPAALESQQSKHQASCSNTYLIKLAIQSQKNKQAENNNMDNRV